jgi:hypothetical protein
MSSRSRKALKNGDGKSRIQVKSGSRTLGSVDIDSDCKRAHSRAPRWDHLVGVERLGSAVAHFIEVHGAETHGVSAVQRKLEWLRGYLERKNQGKLRKLSSEFHWVASGRINIPQTTPQFRLLRTTLRNQGLRGPFTSLKLG